MDGEAFAQALARRLGLPELGREEIDGLLAMAGTAAHSSERLAAPLCTYLAGRSGRSVEEVRAEVKRLAGEAG